MSIPDKGLPGVRGKQEALPLTEEARPSLNGKPSALDANFRRALSEAIRQCPLSRYQIASKLSELGGGREITKSMLDKYTSESSVAHLMPAILVPSFCNVTGSQTPMYILAAAIGCLLAGPEEAKQLEVARLMAQKDELEARIKGLLGEGGK